MGFSGEIWHKKRVTAQVFQQSVAQLHQVHTTYSRLPLQGVHPKRKLPMSTMNPLMQ